MGNESNKSTWLRDGSIAAHCYNQMGGPSFAAIITPTTITQFEKNALPSMHHPPSSVATDDAVTNGNREVRRLCLAVLVGGSHYKHHSSIMTMNVKICYSQAFVLMRRNIGN